MGIAPQSDLEAPYAPLKVHEDHDPMSFSQHVAAMVVNCGDNCWPWSYPSYYDGLFERHFVFVVLTGVYALVRKALRG